jgi:hypothetical protein
MQGDFSRVTFDPAKHFSAVLTQQGRVQLDADANEQAAILLHYLRTLAADLIGPAGYPAVNRGDDPGGFHISVADGDLSIAAGRMYVDGILVENDEPAATYWSQPDGYLEADQDDPLPTETPYLVYLRVWERLITSIEDAAIREIALGDHGPDTCARSRVVWQVAWLTDTSEEKPFPVGEAPQEWVEWLSERLVRRPEVELGDLPLLSAWAKRPDDADTDVCDVDPESSYRGPENQLYRVEIHHGGAAHEATFKWSRENASVVLPIESLAEDTVKLAGTGRDSKLSLEVGNLVEIVDDAYASRVADDIDVPELDQPYPFPRLYSVKTIDYVTRTVTLDVGGSGSLADHCGGLGTNPDRHPYLRRWDHQLPAGSTSNDGAIPVVSGDREPVFDLEDGVTVSFELPVIIDRGGDDAPMSSAIFRRGDYWLIPARVVTGDVDWPKDDNGQARSLPPHGVEYHYAPLAYLAPGSDPVDLRSPFQPLTAPDVMLATDDESEEGDESQPAETSGAKKTAPAKKVPAKKTAAKKSASSPSDG